ncbi:MAG: protein-L-isoaspartate O-methyltransferase family protein [Hyphomicrobiaceae bacterium]
MSDFEIQRLNMVESQVRTSDVTDRRIIAAMMRVPREEFVPASVRPLAYMDQDLMVRAPLGDLPERSMLAPMVFAKLVQLAGIEAGDLVLDVGCATGYSTAILAELAESVVGLEGDEALSERASATLAEQGVDNSAIVAGALREGRADQGPYDVIVLEGRVPEVPETYRDQLKDGGRLVAIVGDRPLGKAMRFVRHGDAWSCQADFDATAPELAGFERVEKFVF